MSRIFTGQIEIGDLGTDADQDIWTLGASSGAKIILHGWQIYTDAIAAAALDLELARRSSGGSGGSAVTEEDHDQDIDATATATMTTDVSTPGTEIAVLEGYIWEQLGPLGIVYTPELRPRIDLSSFIGLHLLTNPANVACRGWVKWEEI